MLSKSQARLFFLIGTVGFSLLFLFLTIDTMRQIPKQTNQDQITEAVKRGKRIWEHNYCMGCHTIFGEGAYYAPELTKVLDRRGEAWVRVFLKDPQAMYPGQRKMTNYNFSEGQIDDLIAYFDWIGKVDLNGFPPAPAKQLVQAINSGNGTSSFATTTVDQPEVYGQLCTACHSLQGSGGNVGPALDGIGSRFDEEYLGKWLEDPQAVKAGTTMPKLPLSDDDLAALTTFLSGLK